MQISLKWVNELVNIETVHLSYLINKLTSAGFEVEEVLEIEVDNETIITLDISATANRPDTLSIQGISLEIAALLNQVPKISNYSTKSFNWSNKIESLSKNFLHETDCLGFLTVTIENLNNLTSPKWLQHKLVCSGLIPENNFKDFQNYIILETGYPFEFYDLEKIQSKLNTNQFNLKLTVGKDSEKFLANNGIEYDLDNSFLMVRANTLPISIGGIIPNKNVEWSVNTKSLLIEGSVFSAVKIRQESRRLGLRTDRSSKYEKAIKNINLIDSFYQLISLLRTRNPNLICKFHTVAQPIHQKNRTITLTFDNIKKVLGPIKESTKKIDKYIPKKVIIDSLKRLKFEVKSDESNNEWEVIVPTLRSDDIVREIDLIEEIGRLYGFDNFLTRLPVIKKIGKKDLSYQTQKKLTNCLTNLGLNELIQYSLVNEKEFIKDEIKLINPLVRDYTILRSSLLPNLLKSIQKNTKQGNLILEGFEYGHTFSQFDYDELTCCDKDEWDNFDFYYHDKVTDDEITDSIQIIQEVEKIGGVFGGLERKGKWSEISKPLYWFEAKGRMEQFFKKLNLSVDWETYQPIKEKSILHRYCSARLYFHDKKVFSKKLLGVFGQINPIMANKLNLPSNLYLFELNCTLIQNQIQKNKLAIYSEYGTYPKIIKDLSFIIHKNNSFSQIQKILYLNGSRFLTDINLLDEYSGKMIPENHTSLCFQFVFQSNKGTLQNKKIENIIEHLKTILVTRFKAIIRT